MDVFVASNALSFAKNCSIGLAHGFKIELLVELVRAGLATARTTSCLLQTRIANLAIRALSGYHIVAAAGASEGSMKDFFISYNREDKKWAEWIAWQLEEAGFTAVIQAWDFVGNWVVDMNKAMGETARTIAVLSPNYVKAIYTQSEWANAFRLDPTGEKDLLIPVRVAAFDPDRIFAQLVYVDLVGAEEAEAV